MTQNKKPFGSTASEIEQFFIAIGRSHFNASSIIIENYPFEPSAIIQVPEIAATSITSISLKARPTITLTNELIILSREDKEHINSFANNNNIKIIDDSWVWSWILEPFLDTEFTTEQQERTNKLLASYGLSQTEVSQIRAEVEEQMLKYNFDTMLWEWVDLDLFDVLCAMRVKYDREKFRDFYWKAMGIALKPQLYDYPALGSS